MARRLIEWRGDTTVVRHGVPCAILPLRRPPFCILIGVLPPLIIMPGGGAHFTIVPIISIVSRFLTVPIKVGLKITLGGLQLIILVIQMHHLHGHLLDHLGQLL